MGMWLCTKPYSVWFVLSLFLVCVGAQLNPCADNPRAIQLPRTARCLIPTYNAKDWLQAQEACERSRGRLYSYARDVDDQSGADILVRCLNSSPHRMRETETEDFWVGVVSKWSRHWLWVNGAMLNPVRYVTTDRGAFGSLSSELACSKYLSVEACVNVCSEDAAAFSMLRWRDSSHACCDCSFRLDMAKVRATKDSHFGNQSGTYYVMSSSTEKYSLVRLVSSMVFSETDSLCATVDTNTVTGGIMQSQGCFSQFPFLCSLGNFSSTQCGDSPSCKGTQCVIRAGDGCVQRNSRPMTWLQARYQCRAAGGDLWTVDNVQQMNQVSLILQAELSYWVGASNHQWIFNAESNVFGVKEPDYQMVRCGHTILGQPAATKGKWFDTRCDQLKSYICQYDHTGIKPAESAKEVVCPWMIPITIAPGIATATAIIGTNTPVGDAVTADRSNLILPIIAACVAAFIILLCAVSIVGLVRRRRRLTKKDKQVHELVRPFWAHSPTNLTSNPTSEAGVDNLSSGLHTTSVLNDSGSVFLFPDPASLNSPAHIIYSDPTYPLSPSHNNGVMMNGHDGSERDCPYAVPTNIRSRLYSARSANSGGSREGRNIGQARAFSVGGGVGSGGGGAAGDGHTSSSLTGGDSLPSTYRPQSPRWPEYATLSAVMHVPDELHSRSNSLERKPEVALVTTDVDMNFTINHAVSHRVVAGSPDGTEWSPAPSVRGQDELDLPLTSTLEIPSRSPPFFLFDFEY